MLNTGFKVLLKTLDCRRILLCIAVNDFRCIELSNLSICLVIRGAYLRKDFVQSILGQLVVDVLKFVIEAALTSALRKALAMALISPGAPSLMTSRGIRRPRRIICRKKSLQLT